MVLARIQVLFPRFAVILFSVSVAVVIFFSILPLQAAEQNCGVSLGEWQTGSPAPEFHVEGGTAVVDGKLFVVSGFRDNSLNPSNRVDVYNPATNIWETVANPRRATPLETSHIQAAVDGQYIWIAGGFKGAHPSPPTNEVWQYDTVEDLWYAGPPLPEPRSSGFLVRAGRFLHYAGGTAFDRNTSYASHWVLNLDNLAAGWQTAPDYPQARIHTSAIEVGGLIYAVGGQFNHDNDPIDLEFVHAFSPITNNWTQKADLPLGRSHFEPGTTQINGNIVIVGGRQNQDGFGQTDDITAYDTTTNTWSELPPLPVPLIAPVAAIIGDKLIVTNGGYAWNLGSTETFISQVSIIPCTQTATPVPATSTPNIIPTDAPTLPPGTPSATPTEIPAGSLRMISPAAYTTVQTSKYVFQWTHLAGITEYQLTIQSSDGSFDYEQVFTDVFCSGELCSVTLEASGTTLPNNAVLKARVNIVQSNTRSDWVEFYTEMPGKTRLLLPAHNTTLDLAIPQFIWSPVTEAESYRLTIKNVDTGHTVIKQVIDTNSALSLNTVCEPSGCVVDANQLGITLRQGVNYRWHIVSISADGKSKSKKATFTVTQSVNTSTSPGLLPLP